MEFTHSMLPSSKLLSSSMQSKRFPSSVKILSHMNLSTSSMGSPEPNVIFTPLKDPSRTHTSLSTRIWPNYLDMFSPPSIFMDLEHLYPCSLPKPFQNVIAIWNVWITPPCPYLNFPLSLTQSHLHSQLDYPLLHL